MRQAVHEFAQVADVAVSTGASASPLSALGPSRPHEVTDARSTGPCVCCVGVLSAAFHAQILADVSSQARGRGDDATTFALNIKLPSVVLLREYALLAHLRRSVDGFAGRSATDLKDVLKVRLSLLNRGVCNRGGLTRYPSTAAPSASRSSPAGSRARCIRPSVRMPATLPYSLRSCIPSRRTRSNRSLRSRCVDLFSPMVASSCSRLSTSQKQLDSAKKRHRGPQPVFDGFGAVTRALEALSTVPDTIQCPPQPLTTSVTATVVMEHEPVYLQGRYLKFKRGLSQTPWVLDGQRMGDSSVEECIGDVALPFFRGKGYKFHTAGREDVDVRMLGNGRPFILEILGKWRARKFLTDSMSC